MPSDSNWKRPLVRPAVKSSYVFASSRGIAAGSMRTPRCASIIFTQLSMRVSVRRPRKSIFRRPMRSTPFMSNCVVTSAGVALEERHQVGERLRGDHDPRGVGRGVAGRALEPARDVDELLDPRVLLVGVLERRRLRERLVEGHLEVERDHLRDLVDLGVAHVHHAPDVAHDGLRLHGPEGDDLRHVVAAVLLRDVLDDLAPARLAEVDVDVGGADALLVQEALEDEVVLDRVDVGDAQAPRRRGCPAAEPRPGPTGIRRSFA